MEPANILKYIIISDLHLGEANSLFTPQEGGNFDLVDSLSDCLADLLKNFNQKELPSLVLNGDILGLAFSNYHDSLSVFKEFLKFFSHHNKICDKVIYIPGNHDHHIWDLAMEDRFLKDMDNMDKYDPIPKLHHITPPIYEEGFSSFFFESFMGNEKSSSVEIRIFYPNFIILPNVENEPFVLLHHGHFSENTYHFVSKAMQAFYPELKTPENLEELGSQNNAWIDFSFSQLGRSGNAGIYFEKLMETLSNKELLKKNIDYLANNIADAVDFPYLPFKAMEKQLAKKLLLDISKHVRTERYKSDTTCSDGTIQGLLLYINTYCAEILSGYGWNNTFTNIIWSHTHKPFELLTSTEKFNQIKLINTGGWVLPRKPVEKIGGSIVLINHKNEVQSLRIFNDGEMGGTMKFAISFADGLSETPFSKHIMECLYESPNKLKPVWSLFETLLKKEILVRRSNNNE